MFRLFNRESLNIHGAASFNGLTFEEGSGMAFSVNGTTPFSSGMSMAETYSHATVGTLSFNGTPTIEVNIESDAPLGVTFEVSTAMSP